jgi:ribonuclease-3
MINEDAPLLNSNQHIMATPTLPNPLPELPSLEASIALDVYAHSSLHYEGKPVNEEYGDNQRLAILGEAVLSMAVTQRLFSKKPLKSAETIVVSIILS